MSTSSSSEPPIKDTGKQKDDVPPKSGPVEPGARNRLRNLYVSALLVLLSLGGITFTLGTLHKVAYPFGWDDDEGAVWWEAAHVTNLSALYHPIERYPYFVVPYPPVFDTVTWVAAQATGSFLIAGRMVCVFSAFGISLLFGLLVWRVSPQRIPAHLRVTGAAVASLLCFRLDSLSLYIPEMGVDLLALFLTFLGVYLFVIWRQRPAALYLAFACFIAAVFTKQTMVAAPLACLVATALINIKKAIAYFLFCVALGALGLGYLWWATDGEALRHLFYYNAIQPFSITHWVVGLQANLIRMIPIFTVACLALLALRRRSRSATPSSYFGWLQEELNISSYIRAAFVLGLELGVGLATSLTYGKIGSGVHYFLEWNLACCPLAGMLLVCALDGWGKTSDDRMGRAAVALLLLLAALTGVPDSLQRINGMLRLSGGEQRVQAAMYSSSAEALKVLEQTPGPALSDNLLLMMEAHKEIPIEPGIQMYLAKAGIWDQSGFVEMIASRKFGVIVMRTLDNGFWTDEIVKAIRDNYDPAGQIGDESIDECHYTVFRPRASPR